MCFSNTGTFSFLFGCVFMVASQEKKSNSGLVLAVFFNETKSIENSSSSSEAPAMLFERERVLYQWVKVIVTIVLSV